MKKEVEITVRTFQNSLFLCFYALEPTTVAFNTHFQLNLSETEVDSEEFLWNFEENHRFFHKCVLKKKSKIQISMKKIFLFTKNIFLLKNFKTLNFG